MKKTTFLLIFFAITLVLSLVGCIFALIINFWNEQTTWLIATKLEQRPETSFLLENPDRYVLQAIDNPDTPVKIVRFLDHTEIFDLMSLKNTTSVEYNDSYYQFIVQLVDYYLIPLGPFLIGAFVSSVAIVIFQREFVKNP